MENYKVPFQFKGVHACEAVVLACIDFRFWRETMQFVDEKLGIKSYDFPKLPGAAKAINEAKDGEISFSCMSVPCDLHHVEKIVLVNHSDCGAYGGLKKFEGDLAAEAEFHISELKKARDIINAKYPGKKVILVFAKLVDEQTAIEFVVVE